MPDIPGSAATTASLTVGGSTISALDYNGDHDWFAINLTAGAQVTITAFGITLEDPYVYLRNASGQQVASNDDIKDGITRSSLLTFTPSASGTYYIDVGAFQDEYQGTYELSVQPGTQRPVVAIDTLAGYLVQGSWAGEDHRFAATQGGSITVNLTTLNATEQYLARTALQTWTDVIGIAFKEVSSGAQITFNNTEEEPGKPTAQAEGIWADGITSSAMVQISSSWVSKYGTALTNYSFETYLHEIGHALGLGHGGDYNTTANYATDALFRNDGLPLTIMSYFDPSENSYFEAQGFSDLPLVTPMLADIAGMQSLYGLSTTTRTGDTVYGFNSTAGGVYDANAFAKVALTILDSGGTDTLDYSGSGANQLIDLNAETFSNVNGWTGNLSIARGTVIENAIGGSGSDTIIGNSAANVLRGNGGNDILTGGAGADTFMGTTGQLSGDTITDFSAGDRIVFTNAALAGFTYALSASTLVYSGGALTFGNVVSGQLIASAAAGGGVELKLAGASGPMVGTGGSDHLVGTSGADVIEGLAGDDILTGAEGADVLIGGAGNDMLSAHGEISFDNGVDVDQISGGAGDDYIFSGYGDIVDGGEGFDTVGLSYVGATHGITGDTNILKQGLALVPGAGTFKSIERYSDIALTAYDDKMVIGDQFEPAVVRSWDGNDYLIGQEVSITMYGGNGNDMLVGSTSNDVLYGEAGDDILMGYLGNDELWGGAGADRFLITHVNTAARIMDFQAGADVIDLTSIDANTAAAGDQAFTFVGTANFTGAAGELRLAGSAGAGYRIEGDVDGNKIADFIVELGSVPTLTAADLWV